MWQILDLNMGFFSDVFQKKNATLFSENEREGVKVWNFSKKLSVLVAWAALTITVKKNCAVKSFSLILEFTFKLITIRTIMMWQVSQDKMELETEAQVISNLC